MAINTKLQNIIDTKAAIGNAITNKGGTITSSTPFYNYAAEIDNISGGGGVGNYSTWVVEDENSAKYQVYNGYHFVTNPTPNLNNLSFNQWLLNNSATGTIVLNNTILTQNGNTTFQDNAVGINVAYMPFVNNSNFNLVDVITFVFNNNIIYTGGGGTIVTYYLDNLIVDLFGPNTYGGTITSLAINNGFIYAGGVTNRTVQKFHEGNLVRVGNTASYGGDIRAIAINNGFIYVGGNTTNTVQKFYEDNLALVGNTSSYGNVIWTIAINNGFIYAGGGVLSGTNRGVSKFYEDNLALVGNTGNIAATNSIHINNGFLFVGSTLTRVNKYYEDNLALVGNTSSFGTAGSSVKTNNGFLYEAKGAGGSLDQTVRKYYEDNLAFVGNTAAYGGDIRALAVFNGFIYAGGVINRTIKRYYEQTDNLVDVNIYSITNVKE